MTFGSLLRQSRLKDGETLKSVSRCLKVSVAYLSDVERGNRSPLRKDRIIEVARYLGANETELLEAAKQER